MSKQKDPEPWRWSLLIIEILCVMDDDRFLSRSRSMPQSSSSVDLERGCAEKAPVRAPVMARLPLAFLPLCSLQVLLLIRAHVEADTGTKQATFETKDECDQQCNGDHDWNCITSSHQYYCRCTSDFYSRQEHCTEECEKQYDGNLFVYGECKDVTKATRGLCKLKCVEQLRLWTICFIFVVFVGGKFRVLDGS